MEWRGRGGMVGGRGGGGGPGVEPPPHDAPGIPAAPSTASPVATSAASSRHSGSGEGGGGRVNSALAWLSGGPAAGSSPAPGADRGADGALPRVRGGPPPHAVCGLPRVRHDEVHAVRHRTSGARLSAATRPPGEARSEPKPPPGEWPTCSGGPRLGAAARGPAGRGIPGPAGRAGPSGPGAGSLEASTGACQPGSCGRGASLGTGLLAGGPGGTTLPPAGQGSAAPFPDPEPSPMGGGSGSGDGEGTAASGTGSRRGCLRTGGHGACQRRAKPNCPHWVASPVTARSLPYQSAENSSGKRARPFEVSSTSAP